MLSFFKGKQRIFISKSDKGQSCLVISRKFLGIIVSKLLFFSVSAISCYRCENSSSLGECQENQVDVDCPIPVHYCAKIKYESTTREGKIQTTYRKGCVTKDQCNATSGKIVDCCKADKCNASKKKLFFTLQNSILFSLVPRDFSFSNGVLENEKTLERGFHSLSLV